MMELGTSYSGECYSSNYKHGLGKNDIEKLSFFIEKMRPILRPILAIEGPNREYPKSDYNKNLEISFKAYRDSLIGNTDIHSRFTLAVSCLDSMYISGTIDSKYRLKLYTAKMLSFFGLNPLKVYNDVGEAYEIRSAVSHGRRRTIKDYSDTDKLCKKVLEYARISLLVFLQLSTPERKTIQETLDESLIDTKADDDILKIMNSKALKVDDIKTTIDIDLLN
jgi:hypothetical protein